MQLKSLDCIIIISGSDFDTITTKITNYEEELSKE